MSPATRTRLLVVLSFIIAFAAGVSLGAVVCRPVRHPHAHSWLAAQLHLNADQQKKMRQIWSDVMQNSMRNTFERRRALRTERDQAVRALLTTPELQKKYEAIQQDYEKKMSDLAQEGGKAREEANRRTLEILNPSQRKVFEDLIKSHGMMHGRGWHGPMSPQGPPPADRGPVRK